MKQTLAKIKYVSEYQFCFKYLSDEHLLLYPCMIQFLGLVNASYFACMIISYSLEQGYFISMPLLNNAHFLTPPQN